VRPPDDLAPIPPRPSPPPPRSVPSPDPADDPSTSLDDLSTAPDDSSTAPDDLSTAPDDLSTSVNDPSTAPDDFSTDSPREQDEDDAVNDSTEEPPPPQDSDDEPVQLAGDRHWQVVLRDWTGFAGQWLRSIPFGPAWLRDSAVGQVFEPVVKWLRAQCGPLSRRETRIRKKRQRSMARRIFIVIHVLLLFVFFVANGFAMVIPARI
jgi:hypothetical protein